MTTLRHLGKLGIYRRNQVIRRLLTKQIVQVHAIDRVAEPSGP